KSLLAHAEASIRDEVMASLNQHAPYTITDSRVLVANSKNYGAARSAQEHRLGISSLAVAVLGEGGLIAAVAVLPPLRSPRLTRSVTPVRAAAAIAEAMRSQRPAAEDVERS